MVRNEMMVREYSAAKRLRDPCWGRLQANKKVEAGLDFFSFSLVSSELDSEQERVKVREFSAAKRLRVPCWGRLQANKKAKAALAFFYSLQSARKQAWPVVK